MFLDLPTHHDRIERIGKLSPTAQEKLQKETYLYNYDVDSATPEAVLEDVFTSLVADAYAVGIEFTVSLDELFDSYYMLDRFLDICGYLMPATLYRHIERDPRLHNVLTDLLDGINTDEDLLVAYIGYLGLDDDRFSESLSEASEFLVDKLHTAPQYKIVLRNILTMDEKLTRLPNVDPENLITYTKEIQKLSNTLKYVVTLLQKDMPNAVRYKHVFGHIDNYISTLMEQDKIPEYAWMFYGTLTDALPLSMIDASTQQLYTFYSTQPLHVEYFVKHQKMLTNVDVFVCIVRIAGAHMNKETYVLDVDAFKESLNKFQRTLFAQNKELLTSEKQTLIKTIRLSLIPHEERASE